MGGCRGWNEGNGYKDSVSVVWSIAITSVPSFSTKRNQLLGNHQPPKHYLAAEGDGGGFNGYILISFVSSRSLGYRVWFSFGRKTRLFRAKMYQLQPPGDANINLKMAGVPMSFLSWGGKLAQCSLRDASRILKY